MGQIAQKMMQMCTDLAYTMGAVAMLATFTLAKAGSGEVLSPPAQRGLVIVRTSCSRCHAIGKVGESSLRIAPAFRTLHERYPVDYLQEPLAEGIITGHPTMPEFRFSGRRHHRVPEVPRTVTPNGSTRDV